MAEANGWNVGTVKSRVGRARAQLRAWSVGGGAAANLRAKIAAHDAAA